jgi:hypothetical protein
MRQYVNVNNCKFDSTNPQQAEVPPGDLPELDTGDQVPSLTPKQVEQKWPDTGLSVLLALAK